MLGETLSMKNKVMDLDPIAAKLINQTLKEVDRVAEPRIRQLINDGG